VKYTVKPSLVRAVVDSWYSILSTFKSLDTSVVEFSNETSYKSKKNLFVHECLYLEKTSVSLAEENTKLFRKI